MENDSGLSMYTCSRVAYMSEILRNIFYDINYINKNCDKLEMSMMIKLLFARKLIYMACLKIYIHITILSST